MGKVPVHFTSPSFESQGLHPCFNWRLPPAANCWEGTHKSRCLCSGFGSEHGTIWRSLDTFSNVASQPSGFINCSTAVTAPQINSGHWWLNPPSSRCLCTGLQVVHLALQCQVRRNLRFETGRKGSAWAQRQQGNDDTVNSTEEQTRGTSCWGMNKNHQPSTSAQNYKLSNIKITWGIIEYLKSRRRPQPPQPRPQTQPQQPQGCPCQTGHRQTKRTLSLQISKKTQIEMLGSCSPKDLLWCWHYISRKGTAELGLSIISVTLRFATESLTNSISIFHCFHPKKPLDCHGKKSHRPLQSHVEIQLWKPRFAPLDLLENSLRCYSSEK